MMKHPLRRVIAVNALLLIAYFLIPVRSSDSNLVVRAVGTLIVIAVVVWLTLFEIRKTLNSPEAPLAGLLLTIVGGLLVFSLLDYIIEVIQPGQFQEIQTRLDALYFGLATLATIGYGDAHAQGQLARGVVCVQMVFNLVIIGAAASVLTNELRTRTSRRDER